VFQELIERDRAIFEPWKAPPRWRHDRSREMRAIRASHARPVAATLGRSYPHSRRTQPRRVCLSLRARRPLTATHARRFASLSTPSRLLLRADETCRRRRCAENAALSAARRSG